MLLRRQRVVQYEGCRSKNAAYASRHNRGVMGSMHKRDTSSGAPKEGDMRRVPVSSAFEAVAFLESEEKGFLW